MKELTLYWRGKFGKLSAHWHPDTIADWRLLQQLMNEAGLPRNGVKISNEQYDAVLAVAGTYGITIATIGDSLGLENLQPA